jgi:hypothetical protein
MQKGKDGASKLRLVFSTRCDQKLRFAKTFVEFISAVDCGEVYPQSGQFEEPNLMKSNQIKNFWRDMPFAEYPAKLNAARIHQPEKSYRCATISNSKHKT